MVAGTDFAAYQYVSSVAAIRCLVTINVHPPIVWIVQLGALCNAQSYLLAESRFLIFLTWNAFRCMATPFSIVTVSPLGSYQLVAVSTSILSFVTRHFDPSISRVVKVRAFYTKQTI